MRSVSTILKPKHSVFIFLLIGYFAGAQENSPFSRYGLGEQSPAQNILNRAMGGISTTYGSAQSVNISNPAAYSELKIVSYDLGVMLDARTLKSANPVQKYNSVNLEPSYVALGMPLNKKRNLGLAFGLRPMSIISYSVVERKRVAGDSMTYLYEGDGGLYQAFVGVGKRWGGLRVGFNTGYMFGSKKHTTLVIPIDSFLTYKSNSSTHTHYGNVFFNAGLQYEAKLNKTTSLRFGFSGNLDQKLRAKQQISRETFSYDASGIPTIIDSIYKTPEISGEIKLPVSYSAGISLNTYVTDQVGNKFDRGILAVEYQSTQWTNYRFYNEPDKLINSWQLKFGGQLTPNPLSARSYWNRVAYRAGFYFGKDAVNIEKNTLPIYALTLGFGFPVRKWRAFETQYTNINTTFEMGKRGNKNNNITENFFRLSFGVNLSDIWFVKRKYD